MKLTLSRVRIRNPLIVKLMLSVVILMILLVLTGIIGYYYLTRPDYMRKQLLAILKSQVNGPVQVEEVNFELAKGLTVYGLEIKYQNETFLDREIEVINIPEINIRIDYAKVINSLLSFEFKPAFELIQVERPSFKIRFDKNGEWLDKGVFNFPKMDPNSTSSTEIPQIIVNNAEISLMFPMIFNEGKENIVKNISFSILQDAFNPEILVVNGYAEAEDIGEIEIEARLNQENNNIDLQVYNHNVQLTPERIKNFIPEIQSVYEDFIESNSNKSVGVNAEIVGRILYSPESAALLDLDVKVINGYAKYFQFPIPIEIVAGHIKLRNHNGQRLPEFGDPTALENLLKNMYSMGNLSADLNILGSYNGSKINLDASIADIGTKSENINIVINAHSVLIDSRFKNYLLNSDESPEAVRTFIKEFDTNGLASVIFVAGKKDIQVTIDIENVNTIFSKFPIPLSKLQGRFEGSANLWDVINLKGETTFDRQKLTFNVAIRENDFGKTVITTKIQSEDITLERDIIELLPESVQTILAQHNIGGTGTIKSAEIVYTSGSPDIDYKFAISPVSVSYRWQNFPYDVIFTSGTVEIDKEMVRFENLTGSNGDQSFAFNGWISLDSSSGRSFDFNIKINNLKIDDSLKSAIYTPLPEGQYTPDKTIFQTLWNMFEPGGIVNLELRISPDEPKNVFAIVELLDATIKYDKFPLGVKVKAGVIQFSNFSNVYYVSLKNIVGEYKTSEITLEGSIQGDPSQIFLHFEAKDCLLDAELKTAYEHLESVINENRESKLELWKMLKPSGILDLSFDIYSTSNDSMNVSMIVDVSQGSTEFVYFPYPLTNVSGRILLDSSGVRLENIIGYHNKTKIEINEGKLLKDGYEFRQVVTNSIVDGKFIEAVPEEWQALVKTLDIQGRFNAVIDTKITGISAKTPTIIFNLRFELPYNSINVGLEINDLTGIISVVGKIQESKVYTVASIEFSSARWNSYKVTMGAMDLIYAENKIEINNFKCRIYQGALKGRIKIELGENAPFSAYFKYSGIQLSDFLSNTSPGSIDVQGTIQGDLAVYGKTGERDSLEGIAKFNVADGWILDVPIVLKLFDFVNYFNPTPIDEVYGEAKIYTNKIVLERLDLFSDAIAFYGKGELIDNNKLNLQFSIDFAPRALLYPQPARWLVKGIERNILPVYIVGTISKPEINLVFPPKTGEVEKSTKKELVPKKRPSDWKIE